MHTHRRRRRGSSPGGAAPLRDEAHEHSRSTLQRAFRLAAVFSPLENGSILHYLSPAAQPVLHSVLFGEGVMNDITAVALLRVGAGVDELSVDGVLSLLTRFVALLLASALTGVAAGLLSAMLTKRAPRLPLLHCPPPLSPRR